MAIHHPRPESYHGNRPRPVSACDQKSLDYTSTLIRHTVRRMCLLEGFRTADALDFEQDLHLAVLKRLRTYDARRASLRTYIARVVESAAISLIRRRLADKRTPLREGASLDSMACGPDGRIVPQHETLRETSVDPWPQTHLTMDVVSALEGLGNVQQEVAQALALGMADLTVARQLHLTLREVDSAKRCIHIHFEDLGLRAYLGDR
jgi:RNA polymerase sigma factor (sigma-70 family)